MIARRTFLPEIFRRFLAAGSAALVFALTVFAASPVAHDRLHDHDHPAQAEDRCAVVLFADGVVPMLDPLAVTPPAPIARDFVAATAADIFLVSPRYLRQPERGPPARV